MTAPSTNRYDRLDRLAEEFAERYRRGERPALQEYTDRYPDLADDIRELFPAMAVIEQAEQDRREPAERPAGPAVRTVGDYRVVREVRYPPWWGWRFWWRPPQGESQEIANGTARTAADGSFTIDFIARPDPSVSEKDEPTFTFSVHADVTDTAGETRSGERRVIVGFTALQAVLEAEEWQETGRDVELKIKTTTLDDEGVAAEGVVRIRRLK